MLDGVTPKGRHHCRLGDRLPMQRERKEFGFWDVLKTEKLGKQVRTQGPISLGRDQGVEVPPNGRGITSILLCSWLHKIFIIHGALLKHHESKEKMKCGQVYHTINSYPNHKEAFQVITASLFCYHAVWMTEMMQSHHLDTIIPPASKTDTL